MNDRCGPEATIVSSRVPKATARQRAPYVGDEEAGSQLINRRWSAEKHGDDDDARGVIFGLLGNDLGKQKMALSATDAGIDRSNEEAVEWASCEEGKGGKKGFQPAGFEPAT
uniref:SMAP domain-containing protein n=1 Tax=Steinernema glaseri TaxID=37863 RepID=A0A1I7ZMK9_9BILA